MKKSDAIIPHTFDAGEGVLIPGEILHHAAQGCRAFIILQPFGCLPNHVVGKGMVRQIKNRLPQANIVCVDYDPGATRINQENRIKLMLANAKLADKGAAVAEETTVEPVSGETVEAAHP